MINLSVSRRALMIGGAMTATAIAAYAGRPRRSEDRLIKHNLADVIPRTVGAWSAAAQTGMVVATSDQAAPAEGYDQLLTRVYRADGESRIIMLLLAYGSTQGGSLQLHRPETCYPGQGFSLQSFSDVDLDVGTGISVRARRFTAIREERVERLIYWTRIADNFPRNTAQEYASIIASVARGLVPDGLLVRLSTIGSGTVDDDKMLADFAVSLVTSATAKGHDLLVGESKASTS